MLITDLREALSRAADASKAPRMQAYMKSTMPYHGVPVPQLKQVCHEVFRDLAFTNGLQWQTLVLTLWREAKFREERYAALQLARDRRARSYQSPSLLTMYEEMILSGAWWDYVDTIAAHCIGPILKSHPAIMNKKMLLWSRSKNMWIRRTSILCQLSFKTDTDLNLLYACIEPSLGSEEFFLRKAIGWALRQYARTDGAEISAYVERNSERLSSLSRREALKRIT
jgi:3-methyladenine DNA glycosylase AlkD